jgi:hypothetical protein
MKKIVLNKNSKNIFYILGYWIVFVITPFFMGVFTLVYLNRHPTEFLNHHSPIIPICVILYSLFIAPFLFFIPYSKIKPKKGFLFIFLGLILPYLFVYLSVYWYIRANFNFGF